MKIKDPPSKRRNPLEDMLASNDFVSGKQLLLKGQENIEDYFNLDEFSRTYVDGYTSSDVLKEMQDDFELIEEKDILFSELEWLKYIDGTLKITSADMRERLLYSVQVGVPSDL